MAAHTISRTVLAAVLVATFAALIARAWIETQLLQAGVQSPTTADLSYLVVPPVLVVLLFPLWRSEKGFLINQFKRKDFTWKVAVTAIAIGVLIRLLWWSHLVIAISFGIYTSSDPKAILGPIIWFQCPIPEIIILGLFVMAILVPLVEEITHRSFIQTALSHRGCPIAIVSSSIIFTLFHPLDSWLTVFLIGLVFGAQYWFTSSLWSSWITHATVNGLIQIDWRCISGQWNPGTDELPLLLPGLTAILVFASSSLVLAFLLYKMATEVKMSPR